MIKKYSYLDKCLSAEEIRKAGSDVQCQVMKEWFHKNFEDPNNNTPRAEGEYLYLCGGPYNPGSVLQEEFMDIIPENIILPFVYELFSEAGEEWAPTSDGDYYEDFWFDEISQNPYADFLKSIKNIETLLPAEESNVNSATNLLLNALLYVHIITALEVYLSDSFLMRINNDDSLFRNLVETHPNFQEQKIPMSSIYANMGAINNIVQNEFTVRFDWHSMDKAKKIYKKILCVEFPEHASISDAIKVRHAIIHQNETILKDGSIIASKDVNALAVDVRKFVEHINKAILLDALKEESEKK